MAEINEKFYENGQIKSGHMIFISLFITMVISLTIFFIGETQGNVYLTKGGAFWGLWAWVALLSSKRHITKWDWKYILIGLPIRGIIYLIFKIIVRKYLILSKSEFREKRLKEVLKKK